MCVEISHEDIRTLSQLSDEYLSKLPTEKELARIEDHSPATELAKLYIRQGSMAIRRFADCFEAGRMDTEDACAVYSVLLQSEQMLGIAVEVTVAEAKSCIGQAESEKKECKEECKKNGKKFCGCLFNSFLAKANCFINAKIDVGLTG